MARTSTPSPAQRAGMRLFLWDGLFSGAIETVLIHFLPLFALAQGASNAQIGLLMAAAGLGAAIACYPGASISERFPLRKTFVIGTRGSLGYAMLLIFAVLPLLGDAPFSLYLLVAAAAARSLFAYLAEGAWTSLAADLVPPAVRGRYFGTRNLVLGAGGLLAAALVGGLVAVLGPTAGWTAAWLLVFALGVASSAVYARIPERDLPIRNPNDGAAPSGGRAILSDANFLRYGGTVLIWGLSVYMAGPFFNVYLVRDLGASTALVGGLIALMAVFGLLGQTVFGRFVDRRGSYRLIAMSGATLAVLPLLWLFVTSPMQVAGINMIAGVAWAAYVLAGFHFLLSLSPPGQQRYYAAAIQTTVFLAAFAGPLLGGAIADVYGIKALFLLSGLGRLLATGLFVSFVRERAPAPRPAPRSARAGDGRAASRA